MPRPESRSRSSSARSVGTGPVDRRARQRCLRHEDSGLNTRQRQCQSALRCGSRTSSSPTSCGQRRRRRRLQRRQRSECEVGWGAGGVVVEGGGCGGMAGCCGHGWVGRGAHDVAIRSQPGQAHGRERAVAHAPPDGAGGGGGATAMLSKRATDVTMARSPPPSPAARSSTGILLLSS